jgi:hypothetical protein
MSHKVYTIAQKLSRVYTEWMIADHAWEMQVCDSSYTKSLPYIVEVGTTSWRNTHWYYFVFGQDMYHCIDG